MQKHSGRLPLALGKDIGGEPVVADLARMPHLMIAGTTGSGKSVGVNAMILSLLYRLSPDQCRMILIDPKMLELSIYEGIPHLMAPVVTEPAKAVTALKWTVREMERRYRAMSQLGVRNIGGYNDRVAEARAKGEVVTRRVQTGFDPDTGRPTFEEQPLALEPLPFIVVVIDEMADLMMVAGKEIEAAVQRLAQMARAAGIHVIMATQRPSVDVITGTIKANFPTRISFQVISKFDSRTILGEQGAEQLLGMGDMLFMQGGGRITRVHGPFVSDEEVEKVVAFLREQGEPAYRRGGHRADRRRRRRPLLSGIGGASDGEKGLFDQAVALVAREGKASTSFIQRHLNIGYNRAAKLIEQMEKEGIVGPANHVGKREVLVRRTGSRLTVTGCDAQSAWAAYARSAPRPDGSGKDVAMDQALSNGNETHPEIREEVASFVRRFPGEYWRKLDENDAYPDEFVNALYRGRLPRRAHPRGIRRRRAAAVGRMRRSWRRSMPSGCNAAACHAQMYIMGTLLRHGSEEQKRDYLPKIATGELRLQAFGVTEPTSGTDTTSTRHASPCATATTTSSTARRSGPRGPSSSDLMLLLARTTPRRRGQEAHARACRCSSSICEKARSARA